MATKPNLRVEVRMGESSRPATEFVFGERVEPFSVGTDGAWAIRGPGTAAEHGYLYFDGETLFAASAEGATIIQRGRPIGTDWLALEVPTNLHLGGVKLAVRGPTSKPKQAPQDTVQEVPASRRVGGPRGPVVPDDEATAIQDPRAITRPKPPESAESERTVIQPLMGTEMTEEDQKTTIQPLPDRQPAMGPPWGAGSAAPSSPQAAPGYAAPSAPHAGSAPSYAAPSSPQAAPGYAAPSSPQAAPPPGYAAPSSPHASQPGWQPDAGAAPPHPGSAPAASSMPLPPGGWGPSTAAPPGAGGAPGAGTAPGAPPAAGPAAPPGGAAEPSALVKALEPIKKGWKEASIPQRIILVLLPFAFVSVFFVFSEPEPEASEEPAPTATATAVASAPEPTESTAVGGVEAPTPAGADAGPETKAAEPETPTKGKTLERKAADAVAAGDYESAAELYDQLSKRHPDKAVYREAAEILRRKR